MRRTTVDPETSNLGPQIENLEAATSELVYHPSEREKRLKAQFWMRAQDNPILTGKIDYPSVRKVLGTDYLEEKWRLPGFQDWFLNRQEFRERLEYLANLALDQMEKILLNEDPKAQSARVNMIKHVSELANKLPRQAQSASNSGQLVQAIGGMDKAQLELLLEKNGVNVKLLASKGVSDSPESAVIDIPSEV